MARAYEIIYKVLVCNQPALTSCCRSCCDYNDVTTRHCADNPIWVAVTPPLECLQSLLSQFSSFSHSVVSDSLRPHGLQHARPPSPSPTPRLFSNSCPSSRWCHPTTSSSVVPFRCPQSFPASGSFPMSQLFASGGQSIGPSASASVFPVSIQSWLLKPSFKVGVLSQALSLSQFHHLRPLYQAPSHRKLTTPLAAWLHPLLPQPPLLASELFSNIEKILP